MSWLSHPAPSRRRSAAQWHNHDVNQAAEVLEVRAVPASQSGIAPGTYLDPDAPHEDLAHELVVDPGGNTGTFESPGYGRFSVKIRTKKNGDVVIKPDTPGLKGKIVMRPNSLGYTVTTNLHDDKAGFYEGDTFDMFSEA